MQELLIKSKKSLQASNILYENEFYDRAVSAVYFACFQISIVALCCFGSVVLLQDVRKYSHGKIIAEFCKDLIKDKKIYPIEIRGYLNVLRNSRETADYEPQQTFSKEDAKVLIEKGNLFYKMIEDSLSTEQ